MATNPFEETTENSSGGASAHGRFVILHHVGYGRTHWDIMLEHRSALATWKVYHDPFTLGKSAFRFFEVADHRMIYLDYEGEVSRGRGDVRRVAKGNYAGWISSTVCYVVLSSTIWRAGLHIERTAEMQWLGRCEILEQSTVSNLSENPDEPGGH